MQAQAQIEPQSELQNIKVSQPCEPMDVDLTRAFIESLDPRVKKVDSDGTVDLFSYTQCNDEDPQHIKACRGLVFQGDKLILKAFSYTREYTADDYALLKEKYPDTSSFIAFDSHEGSLIRIFYASDKWFVSTHRRLDAFKSRWSSSDSFGQHFSQSLEHEFSTNDAFKERLLTSNASPESSILDKFVSTLDKQKQYTFLLQNNKENRIVSQAPEYPRVFHVGTFNLDHELDLNVDVGLPYPDRVSFPSINDMLDYVETEIYHTHLQGIIVFTPNESFKVINRYYKYRFNLRGNESSIKNRYLQIRMEREKEYEFQKLYPEHQEEFDLYENAIYDIGHHIFNSYVDRFIHKKHVVLPQEEYEVMKQCHAWHTSNRSQNQITLNKVMEVMNSQTPPSLNRMIRRYLTDE